MTMYLYKLSLYNVCFSFLPPYPIPSFLACCVIYIRQSLHVLCKFFSIFRAIRGTGAASAVQEKREES